MTPKEAIEKLEGMQKQIVHGSNIFGDIADVIRKLESKLTTRHKYWGAGEADCPKDIRAPNGELHTLRCKMCGLDDPREPYCEGSPNDKIPPLPASACSALSEADRYALSKLPDGWFELHQVPFMVRNPRWRCDRLAAKGALESKTEPYAPGGVCGIAYRTWWRKTPNDQAHARREQPMTTNFKSKRKRQRRQPLRAAHGWASRVKCRYCGKMLKGYLPAGTHHGWLYFRKHTYAGRRAKCPGSYTCTWQKTPNDN